MTRWVRRRIRLWWHQVDLDRQLRDLIPFREPWACLRRPGLVALLLVLLGLGLWAGHDLGCREQWRRDWLLMAEGPLLEQGR